jgi:hypothetical protein
MKKKFVVLETLVGPSKGGRFWTTNTDDNIHSATGELWYREIAFCDTPSECQTHLNPIRPQDVMIALGLHHFFPS